MSRFLLVSAARDRGGTLPMHKAILVPVEDILTNRYGTRGWKFRMKGRIPEFTFLFHNDIPI